MKTCPKCGKVFEDSFKRDIRNGWTWDHWKPNEAYAKFCFTDVRLLVDVEDPIPDGSTQGPLIYELLEPEQNHPLVDLDCRYPGTQHAVEIKPGVVTVGHTSSLDLGYDKGPKAWRTQPPVVMVNLADAKDPNDPEGRSYREVNRARKHMIPIGWLVETENGCRAFVVAHHRDCDQTPLYSLALDDHPYESGGMIPFGLSNGHLEDGLSPIQIGPRLWSKIEDAWDEEKKGELRGQEWFERNYLQHWPQIPDELL